MWGDKSSNAALIKRQKTQLKSMIFSYVWSHLEGTLAMLTFETRLVVDLVVSIELFHPINFFFTYYALLGSASKCCHLKMKNLERKKKKSHSDD